MALYSCNWFTTSFMVVLWKFSEKCLKFFKIGENQRKSLKIAAKQFVFLHFWYLGTAKSKETTSWKPRKQQQTASFPTFFIGWQQKISRFRNFQKIFRFFSEISENFLKKFLKIFWKMSEIFQNWRKPTQKFENGSKTVRFPPLLVPGNCKK